MTNPAADARANAQSKWPGATVAERKRNSIRHQHPTEPDRFMLDTSIGPIHYGVGEDQEIDTAWQPTTGAWDWEMTTNDWQTFARDTFNVGDIFEFQKDGDWVRFDPQSINWIDENTSRQQIAIKQAVAAVVNDDVMEFPEAYGPGRHFQYQNQTARLQKLITIDADTDLPAVTLQGNTIWFEAEFAIAHSSGVEVYLDGVLWQKENNVRVQTADRIEFRDEATGQNVFWYLDYPRAWDSSQDIVQNQVVGQMEVRRQGGPTSLFITVRIPKTWIDAAVFPIYIDPTITPSPAAGEDDGFNRGTSFDRVLGYCIIGEWGGDADSSGYFRFLISGPSGATADDGCKVSLTAWANDSGTSVNATLYAVDENDPANPAISSDFTSDPLTTASVAWSPGSWTQNTAYDSPEIKTIIQELWDSGYGEDSEHIMIRWDASGADTGAQRIAWSYNGDTSKDAVLTIVYTAAGGAGDSIPYLSGLRKRRFQPQIVR